MVPSVPSRAAFRSAWSHALSGRPRGLTLARERDWLLAWDDAQTLYLLNHAGHLQAQVRLSAGIVSACCAEDGSAVAAVGAGGEVWLLAPDLTTRWQRLAPAPGLALATDAFGHYVAVADTRGGLTLFEHAGKELVRVPSPRPLHFLAFPPASPFLVASADYGLVGAVDLAGRWLWREGLVTLAGSLAVGGETIVLACFTEGLQRYTLGGKSLGRLPVIEPCRQAVVAYDGRLTLATGLSPRVLLLNDQGQLIASQAFAQPPTAVALSALGDRAYAALPDHRIACLEISLENP